MSTVEAETTVKVPSTVAYAQWTQFENLPDFLPGIESVTRLSDNTLHWVVSPGGVTREYDAVITEQVPNEVIAWASIDAPMRIHGCSDARCPTRCWNDWASAGRWRKMPTRCIA